jgi:hypothetical protein
MMAIVSSIASRLPPQPNCNASATPRADVTRRAASCLLACFLWVTAGDGFAAAQTAQSAAQSNEKSSDRRAAAALAFLGGAATALAAHEGSHLFFDGLFDANPGVKRVDYAGIPFFAITHTPVSRRREFVISAAGFWAQHAIDEWLLSSRPGLRKEKAPFLKGMLAFNIIASMAYSGAALTRTGPQERDTRGMAASIGPRGVNERWIGVMVLAPAALDACRYLAPHARWAAWTSRAVKVGMVLLVLR